MKDDAVEKVVHDIIPSDEKPPISTKSVEAKVPQQDNQVDAQETVLDDVKFTTKGKRRLFIRKLLERKFLVCTNLHFQ